ncbi:sensor histidine kinase [Microbacterium sp. NIBRBAC000506063]|uniref:sensor histidine kinase n=1 Tax=Microbacterium sp. NIBRBAC000506063 TaxID=2734618 RepID=UPI001BB63B16|nr:histidine kinase [Microbacterium sp. NIBRBAC000506063]QTV80514.1 histidine kinase dimerization/phosphoacceptor domain-containing protein [Microbacterium sp. NIBRBAC000506063]
MYRSSRAAMWTLAAAVGCAALTAFIWTRTGVTALNEGTVLVGSTTTLLLIGALIGVNVGGRKRYVEALIERSRQLAVERDQQAQLAAAAERTRIAREMHDIVSHSLAVVVALAEGAHAIDDPHRSKQANRAIADTAREALTQMRVMLGVLRTDAESEPGASALPLGPCWT